MLLLFSLAVSQQLPKLCKSAPQLSLTYPTCCTDVVDLRLTAVRLHVLLHCWLCGVTPLTPAS